jgi:GNAT superfamily N-acetyltransferase
VTEVRRATVNDAEVLGRLLWDFNTEFETETDVAAVLAARFTRILALPEIVAVLAEDGAEDGGTAVGFALLSLRPAIWFDGPVSQLEELYVVPALRSQGIGTQVLDLCRRLVRDLGSPEMHINVDEVDVDTRRFYERHGFVNIEAGVDYRMLCYVGPTAPTPVVE